MIRNYIVTCGGEAQGDLNDFWTFDVETKRWHKPDVFGIESFCAKRFHTMTTISNTKVITFGGCHSDYVFLNDINLFDLTGYCEDPRRNPIYCSKITMNGE